MNEQERYARVKDLFLEAVELSSAGRVAFLDKHCGGQPQLRHDVNTLLQHHNSETILETQEQDLTPSLPNLRVDRGAATGFDSALLSPQFTAELIQLLRRRLSALGTVISLGILVGITRSALNPLWEVNWIEVVLLVPIVASWMALTSRMKLTIDQLRSIEAVMMSSICMMVVTGSAAEMMRGSGIMHGTEVADSSLNRDAIIVGANSRSQLVWCMIIMIYGIFVPNTWRRAALFLVPVACIPYVTTFAVTVGDEIVADALERMKYVRPVPMPFFAAFSAIYASHLLHRGRAEAFHARKIAQYEPGRLLGRGGVGEVYEAEHSLLQRRCAIKVIRPDRPYDKATLKRFQQEVQATARLTHPNTIEIYDYGETIDGIFFYVMELLPGLSLDELVNRFGPIPASRSCYLIRQVCGAMQEAHDAGLIHRDIKPGNLFVGEQGGQQDVVKVLDFGLVATAMNSDKSSSRSDSIGLMGTPPFMPPEQGLGFGQIDARSDIYSLGTTIYYLVTGSLPFNETSPQTQLLAHVTKDPVPPSRRVDGLASDFEAVILRCLEKDPSDRYQSMRELQQALDECDCSHDWTRDDAALWWQSHAP